MLVNRIEQNKDNDVSDWSGGCLCGAVRYEANPVNSENWLCHCRMCQQWSGSVVSTDAIVPKKDFHLPRCKQIV